MTGEIRAHLQPKLAERCARRLKQPGNEATRLGGPRGAVRCPGADGSLSSGMPDTARPVFITLTLTLTRTRTRTAGTPTQACEMVAKGRLTAA